MVLKQPAPLVGPVCLNSCTICPRLCTSMYHRKQNKAKELCHRGSPQPQSILLSQPRCPVIFKAHTIGHDSLMPVHVIWAAQFAEQRFHRWLTAIRIHQHTRCELVFSLYILSCPLSLSLSQALSIWETYSYCPCAHLAGSGMISAGDWVGISGSWTVLCFFFLFFFLQATLPLWYLFWTSRAKGAVSKVTTNSSVSALSRESSADWEKERELCNVSTECSWDMERNLPENIGQGGCLKGCLNYK